MFLHHCSMHSRDVRHARLQLGGYLRDRALRLAHIQPLLCELVLQVANALVQRAQMLHVHRYLPYWSFKN